MRKSLLLFAIAALSGLIAFIIFPDTTPVSAQGGLTYIALFARYIPSGVEVYETPDKSVGGVHVYVAIDDSVNPASRTGIEIEVPAMAWGGRQKCASNAMCDVPSADTGSKFATFHVLGNQWFYSSAQQHYAMDFETTISNIGYGIKENREFASVESPSIRFLYEPSGPSTYTDEQIPVAFYMYMSNPNSYTAWTSGSVPIQDGSFAVWRYLTVAIGSPVLNTGVSLSVENSDNWLIFIAGALLGIAGGALVGAVQEATSKSSS